MTETKTVSCVPSLSPEVQARVDAIIKQLVEAHAGESKSYYVILMGTGSGAAQVVVKDGVPVGVVPEDLVNPTIAREDAYLPIEDLQKGRVRGIPWGHTWVLPWELNSPSRILYPMKRTGPRADPNNPKFVRITWDEAIDILVDQIKKCKAKYGDHSIETGGVCSGHNEPWLMMYGVACNGGWGCSSSSNNMLAHAEVLGNPFESGAIYSDLLNSKLIVTWALDPTAGSTALVSKSWLFWLSLAKEKGIPIIAIDMKLTNAAATWADQWIPIRPCTDIAMMLAIANVLFKENLYNVEYVSKFVEPTGFQKWKDYVLGKTAGPDGIIDRTPEWAAPICGVPAETISAFAKLYANSKPACLLFGLGGQRISRGWNPARAAIYLQAMTGNIGVSGGSSGGGGLSQSQWFPLPFPDQPGAYGIQEEGWAEFGTPTQHSEIGLYDAILLRDDYQNGKITKEEYYRAIGNNIENPAPNIHMLWQAGSRHPGPNMVDANKAIRVVKALDFFVTGARHMEGWRQLADLILPMAEDFENTSHFFFEERGWIYNRRLIEPPGEVRDFNWVRLQLANKLGVGEEFADKYLPSFQNVTHDKWDATMKNLLKKNYEAWAIDVDREVLPNPPSWDQLQANPIIRIDLKYPQYLPYSGQIEGTQSFQTKSGLIEFYDADLETFDASKIQGYGLYGLGAQIAPMAIYEPPEEGYNDPKAAKYPLVMRDSHARFTAASKGLQNPMLEGMVYRHSVWINPADAKVRGIVDGDLVEVYNDRGSTMLPAYVTSRQTPGSIFMYSHSKWSPDPSGVDHGGCSNVLNNANLQIAAAGQEATNALVEVRKIGGRQ